jgi:hypothetical protein
MKKVLRKIKAFGKSICKKFRQFKNLNSYIKAHTFELAAVALLLLAFLFAYSRYIDKKAEFVKQKARLTQALADRDAYKVESESLRNELTRYVSADSILRLTLRSKPSGAPAAAPVDPNCPNCGPRPGCAPEYEMIAELIRNLQMSDSELVLKDSGPRFAPDRDESAPEGNDTGKARDDKDHKCIGPWRHGLTVGGAFVGGVLVGGLLF